MTAEISILNKHAVALAADSAVTIGDGAKIFTSVHKIFCLSDHHPIGLMIYGGANFLGIPWETIIGAYRIKIGSRKFGTLREYGEHFLRFLATSPGLFPASQQNEQYRFLVKSYLYSLLQEIKSACDDLFSKKGKLSQAEIVAITAKIIDSHYSKWQSAPLIKSVSDAKFRVLRRKFRLYYRQQIKVFLGKLLLSVAQKNKIAFILASITYRRLFNTQYVSGIVIGGYGEKEYFSSIVDYEIETMLNNILKYKEDYSPIDHGNDAIIKAFAQKEMVGSFIEGVHPDFEQRSKRELKKITDSLPNDFTTSLTFGTILQKSKARKLFEKKVGNLHTAYNQNMQQYKYRNFISKIVGIVGVLPKDELAMMAESLVNLTSFKRRISMDAETVGGPIDVAIISKNEGFVWIKRKSYYKQEINIKKI